MSQDKKIQQPYDIVFNIENTSGVVIHWLLFAACINRTKLGCGIPDGIKLSIRRITHKSKEFKWLDKEEVVLYQELLGISEAEPFTAMCKCSGTSEFRYQTFDTRGDKIPEKPKLITAEDRIVFNGSTEITVISPALSVTEWTLSVNSSANSKV